MKDIELGSLLSEKMIGLFKTAAGAVKEDPTLLPFALKTIRMQKKAARMREDMMKEGLHIPPFMILSVTGRCNLDCHGCYAKKFGNGSYGEMERELIDSIISQAEDLGISITMIAGGEPLMRNDILDIMEGHPKMIFPLFTNGTLLDEKHLDRIRKNRHIVPVLSFEGREKRTDGRRGAGTFSRLSKAAEKIHEKGLFWGVSLTVTRSNFDEITDPSFIEFASDRGCRLFFFVEYIPVAEGSDCEVPTQKQRKRIGPITDELGERFPGIFISFPGDEEIFGGCLSSGRGFVHVNPRGELEPCPFAPYSDTNLKEVPLKDALRSRLLERIRENHHLLEETTGGCALWRNREWVMDLARK
jgi:MoaA/NifB/PqqE/SkfB family radical SAM enzyme